MLINRISQHIRSENWAAATLDLVVVIVGVFIAIQIEQLYSDRNVRSEERRHLVALREDFERTREELERVRDRYVSSRDSAVRLLQATDSAQSDLGQSEFYNLLSQAILYGRFGVDRRTWDVLTAGGEIGVLRNGALKSRVSAFFAEEEVVAANYNEITAMWDELDKYAMSKFDYVEIVRTYHPEDLQMVIRRQRDIPIAQILGESEFRDWMAYKWHVSRDFLDRFEGLLDQANQILSDLDDELGLQPSQSSEP